MPNASDKIVGRTLKGFRERAGLTQVEFANNSGFSQSFVSKVENGSRSLKLSEVFRYATELDVDARDVMSELSGAMRKSE